MADDDEVDILGDFNLDNLFSKDDGRLGSCYDSGVSTSDLLHCDLGLTPQWLLDTQPYWYSDSSTSLQPDHWPTDSDNWSEKEKSLLEKGLELFGRSWARLSQFIGTKTSHQVRSYMRTHQEVLTGNGSDFCPQETIDPNHSFSELIDDIQIPASMEEVIAVVSTAQPTVPAVGKKNVLEVGSCSTEVKRKQGHQREPSKAKRKGQVSQLDGKKVTGRKVAGGRKARTWQENEGTLLYPTLGAILSTGEEVVRIVKDSEEDDEEIEVGSDQDTSARITVRTDLTTIRPQEAPRSDVTMQLGLPPLHDKLMPSIPSEEATREVEFVMIIPPPRAEVFMEPNTISDQEKKVHAEFFEGRQAKTPKRYLKIRNHILDCWRHGRPSYVTKTSVRVGLKNCGDVNCIGRVHNFLEQVGAINYGCAQVRYGRPLYQCNLGAAAGPTQTSGGIQPKEKPGTKERHQAKIEAMRPRKKKDAGDFSLDGGGGYTITHSADGQVLAIEGGTKTLPKPKPTKQPIKLIYCSKYSDKIPAPFSVSMGVSSLLLVDLHSRTSTCEVMGLLGGGYNPVTHTLQVSRAVPCRSASTRTHCDMCPVSQTVASEQLEMEGLKVVGWYHSHPGFKPQPSQQDVSTQATIQNWCGPTSVGLIVSPRPGLVSSYTVMTVDERGTPYSLKVSLSSCGLDLASLATELSDLLTLGNDQEDLVDFSSGLHRAQVWESASYFLESSIPAVSAEMQRNILQILERVCVGLSSLKPKLDPYCT